MFADELYAGKLDLETRLSEAAATAEGLAQQEFAQMVSPAGIDFSTPELRAKVQATFDERVDHELQDALIAFDASVTARREALAKQIENSRRPPKVQDGDLRELLLHMRFQGLTLSQFADEVEATTDADEPKLAEMIERGPAGRGDWARVFRLVPDTDNLRDVAAIRRIQNLIEERREARQDKAAVTELTFLEESVAGGSLNLSINIRDAKRFARDRIRFRVARAVRDAQAGPVSYRKVGA